MAKKRSCFSFHQLFFNLVFLGLMASCTYSQPLAVSHTPENFLPVILNSPAIEDARLQFQIPAQSDWVDYGTVFEAGVEGEWDLYLWGGFAFSTIKMDGKYYLYYQGASDYRTEFDETVLWRSIGVATSDDGVNFTKYEGNPILTWFPNQNGEEGAVSSGVTLGDTGEIVLFYGANTEESVITINSDVRVAFSSDGLNFRDGGMVIDHRDRTVWGNGDELFPVDAIYDQGRWVVYYVPNGSPEDGNLGVAFGNSYNQLNNSAAVMSGTSLISVWGTAGHARISENTYALILNNVREKKTEVRLTLLDSPNQLSEPVATYDLGDAQQASFLLDVDKKTWFMYYRTPESYGVKLAPASQTDTSLPSTPQDVKPVSTANSQITLNWQAAEDPDTGIVQYRIYRDGMLVGQSRQPSFIDQDVIAGTMYQYQISAVNYHGVEGQMSQVSTVIFQENGQ